MRIMSNLHKSRIATCKPKEGKELDTNTTEKLVNYTIHFFLLFETSIYLSTSKETKP